MSPQNEKIDDEFDQICEITIKKVINDSKN